MLGQDKPGCQVSSG